MSALFSRSCLACVALVGMMGCAKKGATTVAAEEVAVADDVLVEGSLAVDLAPEPFPVQDGPAQGYLQAHRRAPVERLGGALEVRLGQQAGGVYVLRPAEGATLRDAPRSDRFFTMYNARLDATLVDATAADAGSTGDQASLEASWEDDYGNRYGVRCCTELLVRGAGHPTFGGVVTHHLVNGFTGVGEAELPTVMAFAGMWGVGDVLRNGEVVDSGVVIRLMLTESPRDDNFKLVDDAGVNPQAKQLHLLAGPLRMQDGALVTAPVNTEYTRKREAMPFWHVVFPHFRVDARSVSGS